MAAASRHALMFPSLNLEKPTPNLPTDRRDLNLEGSHVLSQHVGLSCPSIFEPRQSGGRVAVRRLRAALRVRGLVRTRAHNTGCSTTVSLVLSSQTTGLLSAMH